MACLRRSFAKLRRLAIALLQDFRTSKIAPNKCFFRLDSVGTWSFQLTEEAARQELEKGVHPGIVTTMIASWLCLELFCFQITGFLGFPTSK